MNSLFTFKPQPFDGRNTSFADEEIWEVDSPNLYEYETPIAPPPLNAATVGRAVAANRGFARQLGWGCLVGGQVRPIHELLALLGLTTAASEEAIAQAIGQFQQNTLHQTADGQLGPSTWQALRQRKILPASTFNPASWPVSFNGQRLGILEKTAPYSQHQSSTSGGVEIQTAFRVTNPEAVRKAGFVDSAGEPQFRWIQIIELRRIGVAGTVESVVQKLRKRANGFIIDPTAALLPLDPHPYYWYESAPPSPGFHINNYLNTQAPNGLCYNLLFYDRPSIPFAAAQPGKRAYFNFETALVGIRPTHRNVILNTFVWGFDLMLVNGAPKLGVNVLRAGPTGGSPGMRNVLSREIAAGSFPGHCFVGGGFARTATCA